MTTRTAFIVAVAILTVYNVARGLGAFGRLTGVAAILLALAMLAVARAAQLGSTDLGLAASDVPNGLRYGAAVLGLVVVVLVVTAAIPATSHFLDDERADLSVGGLVYAVVVSTLLVTVLPEELAFRGVLLGAGRELWSDLRAVVVSSLLFGLWHISPTLGTMSSNRETAGTAASAWGAAVLVAGSVAITFAAGVVFCWLRIRSRSLVAPVLAHVATNGAAFVVAWFVVRGHG
ncbi:MAG TPA: CPBP family intramembrane glutamic endopeptidase [Acidimicrobiia bacterium]